MIGPKVRRNTIVVLAAIQKGLLVPQSVDRHHKRAILVTKSTRINNTRGLNRIIIVQKRLSALTSFRSSVDRQGLSKTAASGIHRRFKKVFAFAVCVIKVSVLQEVYGGWSGPPEVYTRRQLTNL